jgi:hypothetical protein
VGIKGSGSSWDIALRRRVGAGHAQRRQRDDVTRPIVSIDDPFEHDDTTQQLHRRRSNFSKPSPATASGCLPTLSSDTSLSPRSACCTILSHPVLATQRGSLIDVERAWSCATPSKSPGPSHRAHFNVTDTWRLCLFTICSAGFDSNSVLTQQLGCDADHEQALLAPAVASPFADASSKEPSTKLTHKLPAPRQQAPLSQPTGLRLLSAHGNQCQIIADLSGRFVVPSSSGNILKWLGDVVERVSGCNKEAVASKVDALPRGAC